MIGGQIAMFGNQAQLSQQVGANAGISPMGGMQGQFQNPYPHENTGAKLAGGMAMAAPGVMAGMSMAGGFIGGPLEAFDPFTMGARGFASGVGAGGMGFGGTMGTIGRTFMQGGMRAGMGALGGGLMGAAVGAAPIMAAGAAVDFMAGNMYQGAQNIAEIGGMAQSFGGPQYGQGGSRWGGAMGRQAIKNLTGSFHELMGSDSQATMEDLKRLTEMAGRAGSLTGLDAEGMGRKIKGMFKQVKDISNILGITITEGAGVLQQMNQMGLWKTSDIVGVGMAQRVAGPQATPALMQTMQAGGQLSFAMGGTQRAGAMMGQKAFMGIGAAQRAGALSDEDIMKFTGGIGGAEGQAIMAQDITGMLSRFGQSSAGRMMMAGLGEMKGGEFTGGIDKKKMSQFLSSGSVGGLQAQGMKNASSRRGAMSFYSNEEELAENLGAEGGIDAMKKMVESVIPRVSSSEEDFAQVRHHLLRQMFGASNRQAKMLAQKMDNLEKEKDQSIRESKDAIDQAFRNMEFKRGRSLEAFEESGAHIWEGVKRPFQEAGEKLTTGLNEASDTAQDLWEGRGPRGVQVGSTMRNRFRREGLLTQDFGGGFGRDTELGQDWINGDWRTNMNDRMRQSGFGTKATLAMGAGFLSPVPGGTAMGAGAALFGIGEGASPRAEALKNLGIGGATGDLDLGGGIRTTRTELEKGMQRAQLRAGEGVGAKELGLQDRKVDAVASLMSRVVGQNSAEMEKMKKDSPEKYTQYMLGLLRQEDHAGALSGMSMSEQLDHVKAAETKLGYNNSKGVSIGWSEDLARPGGEAGIDYTDPDKQDELFQKMVMEGTNWLGISDVSTEQLKGVMNSKGSDIFMRLMKGEISSSDAISALVAKGDDKTRQLVETLQKDPARLASAQQKYTAINKSIGSVEQQGLAADLQKTAEGTSERVRGLGGASATGWGKILDEYKKGTVGEARNALQESSRLAGSVSDAEARALDVGGGSIGQNIFLQHEAKNIGAKGGSLTKERLSGIEQEWGRRGYDLKDLLGDDYKKLTAEGADVAKLGQELQKRTGARGPATTEAQKSSQDKLLESLTSYTDANKRFVEAVNHALDGKLESAAKAVEKQHIEHTKTAPEAQ
jgi:hypothetical protein